MTDTTDIGRWIVEENGGFYWLDETGDLSSKCATRAEAEVKLTGYCIYLNDGIDKANEYLKSKGY